MPRWMIQIQNSWKMIWYVLPWSGRQMTTKFQFGQALRCRSSWCLFSPASLYHVAAIDPGDGSDRARNYEDMMNCTRYLPPSRHDETIELGNRALRILEDNERSHGQGSYDLLIAFENLFATWWFMMIWLALSVTWMRCIAQYLVPGQRSCPCTDCLWKILGKGSTAEACWSYQCGWLISSENALALFVIVDGGEGWGINWIDIFFLWRWLLVWQIRSPCRVRI